MVVQDDYIVVKSYRPPPQHVVSGKKRRYEAVAESAQHQARGGYGYLNEEQRECIMRCMAASRHVHREVAMSLYGPILADVAGFLEGGRERRSVWQRVREKFIASAGGNPRTKQFACDLSSYIGQEMPFQDTHPGDTSALLPCAVLYPNMHSTDRPELLNLLLQALHREHQTRQCSRGNIRSPLLGCTIRSTKHTTLSSILRVVHAKIMNAVDKLPLLARGPRKGGQRFRTPTAPQGTLGEVMSAYRTLVDGLAVLNASSLVPSTGESAASVVCPSVLLLFEDVEALSNRLLEDLLRLLAEASAFLPARLVFLVSPAFALAQNLGNGATATLEPATFILPPSHVCFEQVLERLFLEASLPVTVSGQVLRFFRVTFFDLHYSIITFLRHLDFMLRMHFSQLISLLCMMPYDLVAEKDLAHVAAPLVDTPVAALWSGEKIGSASKSEGPLGDDKSLPPEPSIASVVDGSSPAVPQSHGEEGEGEGKGVGGRSPAFFNKAHGTSVPRSGDSDGHEHSQEHAPTDVQRQVLVLTREEGGMHDSHHLMVLHHMDNLLRNRALRALLAKRLPPSASGAEEQHSEREQVEKAVEGYALSSQGRAGDRIRQFQCLRGLVHQQVAGRFELRLGCYLIHEALKMCGAPPTGQKSDASAHATDHAGTDGASRHNRHAERPGPTLPTRLMLLEVLLDYERPQRWRKLEASLWEGLASLTLEGLKNLVLAWLHLLQALLEQMPLYVRRSSRAINDWIVRVRELWMLLKALGKEIAKEGKQQQRRRKSQKLGTGSERGMGGRKVGTARDEATEENDEERRHMYRLKRHGITMDTQSLLVDVIEHCTQTLAQATSYFKGAFWYTDTQAIQEAFFAQPRASAVRALNDSQSYLRCACCRPGQLDPTMPDISLVYGLYEAHQGRTINLRAWFASFADVICGPGEGAGLEEEKCGEGADEGENGKHAGKKRARTTETSVGQNLKPLWARFLHAVDELEHLGFTRPYGKKTGDRAKLIFAYTLLGGKQERPQEEMTQETE